MRMTAHSTVSPLVVSILVAVASTHSVAQENGSALINEALDKPIELDVDTTLPQALKAIEDKRGVKITASPAVYDMLPWGDQTKLTAKVSNQSLRQALTAITAKLGLRFTVGDDAVELKSIPSLARLGRRVTIDELGLIDDLATHTAKAAGGTASVQTFATDLDADLQAAKTTSVVDNRVTDDAAKQTVRLPRGVNYLAALDELHRQTRATWYPVGKNVVILPKEEMVRTLLARPVSVRFSGVDVSQVLTELSRRSTVDFQIEPGAVQRIPPENRTIRMELQNVSTSQALESIAGFTGLGYVQREDGVYLWNPAATPVTRRPDRVIGIVKLENGVEVLLPENEVPADVKDYLNAKKESAFKSLRDQMKKEGFKASSTQPNDG